MSIILWLIIGAEIAFWVVIIAGLTTRYIMKQQKLSMVFFALVPVIDIVLLTAATIDMLNGASATIAHALAAAYIAVSLVFGKRMIARADKLFRQWVLKEHITKDKLFGMHYANASLQFTRHHILAYLVGTGLMWLVVWLVGQPDKTEAMTGAIRLWTMIIIIDGLITASYYIWPKKQKTTS